MQNRVEPPILISRLMTLVLATAMVVLGVLVMTLVNLFPLNRPQVFFLTTNVRDNLDVQLVQMPAKSESLDNYKSAFVREYIKHRNEIFTNPGVMQKKWNYTDGVIKNWSSPDVYAAFANTAMFNAIMSETPDFAFHCPVSFYYAPTYLARDDMYQVKIKYFCANNAGPLPSKDYTIKIKLAMNDGTQIKWADRIDNPLGLRVVEYKISEGDGDPLDTGFLVAQ